ncbi:sulfate transporter family-domain-containing protein [Phakopsora pachyrhizi]|nr:sulfate transporter family-domain-containing protein [Phakopsora pachyrhizi]
MSNPNPRQPVLPDYLSPLSIPITLPISITNSSSSSSSALRPEIPSPSHQVSYSANQSDLRTGSSHLADLALCAESSSIRSFDSSSVRSAEEVQDDDDDDDDDDGDGDAGDQHQALAGNLRKRNSPESTRHQRPGAYQTINLLSSVPNSQRFSHASLTTIVGERDPLAHSTNHNPSQESSSSSSNLPYGSINDVTIDASLPVSITKQRSRPTTKPSFLRIIPQVLGSLPPVTLGLMMNILDGVSYGLIMFPSSGGTSGGPFNEFGGIGVSMFFVTCIISQLVYSLGGSSFSGATGSMMIESVPFMHVIANKITKIIGPELPERIIATTMVAFALSSIFTGFAFFLLGALRMGKLMGFFPRHILVGCIGSVGVFLFITGIEVTGKLTQGFSLNGDVIGHLLERRILPQWTVPLSLAILLRIITRIFTQPFVVPAYFIFIPVGFYSIIALAGISLDRLRQNGWIFEFNTSQNQNPLAFYKLFRFDLVDLTALRATITAQLAMIFFGLLHVPLNVPALALSTGKDDLDVDRELIAHGISNTLAGFAGTVSNYLCYVNSVLFTRVGGDSRVTGVMLAAATSVVFAIGPAAIAYIPVCVVGALIYVLGIDLIKEAVWDTLGKVSWVEYGTIWAIIIFATWHDFVVGIVVGIVLACLSFVVTSSQHRAIRSVMDGRTAISTVRRHPTQHTFLKKAGTRTRVLKLQGHLFFGTISACEQTIKNLLNGTDKQPIQFLIVDFSSTVSIDFSAVEAFLRIYRRLRTKSVIFVICGVKDQIGKALRSVGLWSGNEVEGIEVFEFLNEALEHCENELLKSLYFEDSQNAPITLYSAMNQSNSKDQEIGPLSRQIRCQGNRSEGDVGPILSSYHQPVPLLVQTFRPFLPTLDISFWLRIAPLFSRTEFKKGETVWRIGSKADCFYLIEKGILRASYGWPKMILSDSDSSNLNFTREERSQVEESMLPGTVAGDYTFLAELNRNTEVVAEVDAVLWRIGFVEWRSRLGSEEREIIGRGMMKMSAEEEEVLVRHLFTRF